MRGAILADGPGLAGGGSARRRRTCRRPRRPGPPDPFALVELSRDVRPPDYATEFARQATQLLRARPADRGRAVVRPEWLAAVVLESGVIELLGAEALALDADD